MKSQINDGIGQDYQAAFELSITESAVPVKPLSRDPSESCQEKIGDLLKGKSILFGLDEADIDASGQALLDSLAVAMRECPSVRVEVLGHTDNSGSHDHNIKLSERRANAAIDYLINAGISTDRLKAAAVSESKPVADNDTEEGMGMNRRIEFRVRGG